MFVHLRHVRRRSIAILALLTLALTGSVLAAPAAGAAETASIKIRRVDNTVVVYGFNFWPKAGGAVQLTVDGKTGQRNTMSNKDGYFSVAFSQLGTADGSKTSAVASFGSVKRTSSYTLPKSGSGASSGTDTKTEPVTTSTTTVAASTPAPSAPAPAPATGGTGAGSNLDGWNLVKSDEFNDSKVDESLWGIYEGVGNGGTAKRVRSAVSEGNGELTITGRGDTAGGVGMKYGQTYGRYEIRAKYDKGAGYGGALLLWPSSENWPTDGEIDISEVVGADRSSSGSHLHWDADHKVLHHGEKGDFSQWHTYAVEWETNKVTWFLDGKEIWTVTQPGSSPTTKHFLGMQFDTADGNYIPKRNSSTPEEVKMHIDYARIYSR